MFTEQQIQDLVKQVIAAFKRADPNYASNFARKVQTRFFHNKDAKEPVPEYFPSYPLAVDYFQRVRIHSELGYFPESLFEKRSPNQTDAEFKYIKDNYKQTTLPFFIDYVSTVSRAFSDPNATIDYQEDDKKFKEAGITFQKYVESEIKVHGSIENYIRSIIPSIKAQDANGLIVVKPNQLYTKTITAQDESGKEVEEVIYDDTQLDTPVPYYFNSKQVVAYEEGVFAMVELNEKSEVNYGNAKYRIGKVYEFYDESTIWRITQKGKWSDFVFDISIWYEHNWNRVPFTRLKGIPRIYGDEVIWMSPLLYVTDLLDLALLNSSNLQVSINNCVYPYRIMYGDVCEFNGKDGEEIIQCNGGNLMNGAGMPIGRKCPECGGTGLKSRISPMGVMLIRPSMRDDKGDVEMKQKPMEYVSPSVETLNFLRAKIAEDYQKAQRILHLNSNDSHLKPQGDIQRTVGITATQVVTDLKALYAFVKTISDQTYDIYQFILDAIGWMRYGQDYKQAIVKYPTTFDFANEMDYIIQLGEANKYDLPPYVLYSIIYKYLKSIYNDDKDAGDAFKLITLTDRLLTLSNADIQIKLAAGTIEKWEEILHTSAPSFVQQLVNDYTPICDPKKPECMIEFFDQELTVQQDAIRQMAKDKAKEIADNSPTAALQKTIIKNITEGKHGIAA